MRVSLSIVITLLMCSPLNGQPFKCIGTDFHQADSVAQLYPKYPLNDLKILSDNLTRPFSTDVEKFRSIFKWVCLNIESDYKLLQEYKDKREKLNGEELRNWEKKFSRRVFSMLLDHHRTICTGYAYLVKELAIHAGLNCRIIDGYSRNARTNIGGKGIVNHSWNAIELDGKWYQCDATWSSGIIDGDQRQFMKKYDNAYFLPDPELFNRNHFPIDSQWLLVNDKPTLHEFMNAPLVYVNSFHYDVKPLCPLLFNIEIDRGGNVLFQFMTENGSEFSKATLLVDDFKTDDMFTRDLIDSVENYSASHTFLYKGRYAVHVVVDGNHVLSYNVRVK